MKLLNETRRDLLSKYPLYSQDGKKADAVAVCRFFITGTAATYYAIEGDPNTGECYGIYKVIGGWEFGYFYLPELEQLNEGGGMIHAEADEHFTPSPLRDIPELNEKLEAMGYK